MFIHPDNSYLAASDTALKIYHTYFNQMQSTYVCGKQHQCWTLLCCVYTCGHESSQGGFDSEYCQGSVIPKLNLFYDNYCVKYIAENSES